MALCTDNTHVLQARTASAAEYPVDDSFEGTDAGDPPGLPYKRFDVPFLGALLFTIGAWFSSFPLLESVESVDVVFDSTVLAASCLGLVYVRRLRIRPIELGWKLLIWGHLVCLLDCFTQEQGISPVAVSSAMFTSESATITAVLWGFHIYLSRRQAALQYLRHVVTQWKRSESRYAKLVNSIDGIVWEADRETFRLLFVSRKAEVMLGYPVSRWVEEPNFWRDHIAPEDREWVTSFRIDETRRRLPHEFEYRMVAADGRTIWVREIVNFLEGPTGEARLCGVIIEIDAAKELEKALRARALRDDLTALPSRTAFLEALQALDERTDSSEHYAVMFLDLDRFKRINDSLGHVVGDRVLVEVAARIARAVEGLGFVARIGGDEFAVLSTLPHDERVLLGLASNIHTEMETPIMVDEHRLTLSLSIGIAVGAPGDAKAEALLCNADIAMYRSKRLSPGSTRIFDAEMRLEMSSALALESQLRTALDRQEFELHYQPVVDLDEGEILAFEALLRWHHPERGLLTAAQFLPQAEESKVGAVIGWWAVRSALVQSEIWTRTLPTAPLVSVNISKGNFGQPNLLDEMRRLVRETGADPRNLILEITEDVVGSDGDADEKLDGLHRMGFILALDDFGVGCSSLCRLLQVPVQMIKLDRRFIPHEWCGREEALIRTVLAIGKDLSISIVAEGIETTDQCRRLRELGCKTGQGYLFSPAVPADEADTMLIGDEKLAVVLT